MNLCPPFRQMGRLFVIGLFAALSAPVAQAQQNGVAVQLPTIGVFNVQTTVSVPDSGAGIAAAIKRARTARALSGLPLGPKRAAVGGEAQAAAIHVAATIHDQAEMDEAVLRSGEWAQAGKKSSPPQDEFTLQLAQAQEDSAGRPQASVAEIRQRRAVAEDSNLDEGLAKLELARAAEKAGKKSVARIYYQMAARRLQGKPKQQALAKIETLARR
jgi:hypothetical protein